MRFWASVFLHQTNRPGTLIMGLKCFFVMIRFRRDIGDYLRENLIPRCNSQRTFKKKCLPRRILIHACFSPLKDLYKYKVKI
jgi:hypothetical protein